MIPDITIMDWHVDDADNLPTDGTYIGTDMPRQLRNIKSITREEYDDRWEAFPSVPTKVDAKTVTVPTDGTDVGFPIPSFTGWAVRFHSGSGVLSYGYVTGVTIGTPTTIVVMMTQGVISDTLNRMDIGMIPESRAYHELGRHGTFTISGTSTTATVTFASIALPPMPRTKYQVLITPTEVTGLSPASNAFIPPIVATTAASFTVTLVAAPGAGFGIIFDWAILFPFQSVNN